MLAEFARALGGSGFSTWLRLSPYGIQTLQTIHILALAALIASAFMLDLRLLGITRSDDTAAHLRRRFLPAHWIGFAVLLLTGALLIAVEPVDLLFNTTLRIKLALIVIALLLTVLIQRGLWQETLLRHLPRGHRTLLAIGGALSLTLWTAIAACGRFIAYVG